MPDLTGNPDAVAFLLEQHRTIRRLMASVKDAAPAARAESFEPLVRLLAVHETVEEMVIYPALRRSAGEEGERIGEERKAEEDAAKKLLAHLEQLDPASDECLTVFTSFSADVEAHAQAEEGEVFPLLARTNDADELIGLGGRLQMAEGRAPTHPHRSAPESAVGNMLVGPVVSMVDRVRDLFHDARRR